MEKGDKGRGESADVAEDVAIVTEDVARRDKG